MKRKKWLAALLSLIMVVTMLPVTAFAAEEVGTSADNPIQISSAEDLKKIDQSDKYLYAELTADINLADADSEVIDSWWNGRIKYFRGELDGNGHTITASTDKDAFIGYFVEGELKDIKWHVTAPSSLVAKQDSSSGKYTYSNITVTGSVALGSGNNNESVLVTYAPGDTTFDNVHLNMDMSSPTYNGLFIGYEPYKNCDYVFNNCSVTGNYNMAGVGVLFGNGSYSGDYGLHHVLGVNGVDKTSNVSVSNMDLSNAAIVCTDSRYTAKLLCGVSYQTAMDSLEKSLASNVIDYQNIQTAKTLEGVTVALNSDNQLKITVDNSALSNIGSFEVISEVYASMYTNGASNGTNKFAVSDTLTVQNGVTEYYSYLGKVPFYDNSAAGTIGTTGLNGSLGIVTVGGNEYYTIIEENGNYNYNFGSSLNDVGNSRVSGVRIAVYDTKGNLMNVLNTTLSDVFTISTPSFSTNDTLEVGDTLSQHALQDGWDWVDSAATIVEGGQWAFAVNGNAMVPVKFTGVAVGAASVSIGEDVSLQIGQSEQLEATILPENTTDKTVTWTSSNPTVATVDETGKVIALADGETTITATVGTVSDTCVVTVEPTESQLPSVDPSKPVEEVTLGVAQEGAGVVESTIEKALVDIALGNEPTGVSAETASKIAQAVNNGETISTEVVADLMANAETTEEEKILSVLNKNETVAQYMNLRVLVKANNVEIGEITELNNEITFTIAIPEALKAEGRSFFVVRLHDGLAEKLDTVMNDDGTLSFATDKFSTYALAYADPVSTNPSVPEDKPAGENQTDDTNSPQTGDDSNMVLWIALLFVSGTGLFGATAYNRKKKYSK